MRTFLAGILVALPLVVGVRAAEVSPRQTAPGSTLQVINRQGAVVSRITDGDSIQIRVSLAPSSSTDRSVALRLVGSSADLPSCIVRADEDTCSTELLTTLGWYWQSGGQASRTRTIEAWENGSSPASVTIEVAPRPVVMVHGFASSWQAWVNYLGPTGYLVANGLTGFAVGDGQAPGVMETGNLNAPESRTYTIAENAAILGDYIAGVKRQTGAEQVDLVAHSMGGLIARYYIDRVMSGRDVAQLLMLGSPMAGTDCANLPASLGLYLPASLEIRPSYVEQVFNSQITHRHGVPFHALAGTPIIDGFRAPCTAVPTDLAVSLESATAIPVQLSQLPVLHMNLNLSADVFHDFVLPLLQTPAGGFPSAPDPATPASEGASLQFSRLFSGHIAPGASQLVTIPIDPQITVAGFALYDTSRSLQVTVRGASGNIIDLSPDRNGLVIVTDRSSLFYLGYGFQNPKPGEWSISLQSTSRTPATGADYALAAHLEGGATIQAQASTLLPALGQPVDLTATLSLGGQALPLAEAQAVIRGPDGALQTLPMKITGSQALSTWSPPAPGVYAIDLRARGTRPDGGTVERTAFLSVEAQPRAIAWDRAWVLVAGVAVVLVMGGVLAGWVVRRRGLRRAS